MTQHFPTRQLRFFLTAPSPCPYLPERFERKVFAHLPLSDGAAVNDSLTAVGFRRSQNIAYRPACEACSACVSARIPASEYVFSRSERKILSRNEDDPLHIRQVTIWESRADHERWWFSDELSALREEALAWQKTPWTLQLRGA